MSFINAFTVNISIREISSWQLLHSESSHNHWETIDGQWSLTNLYRSPPIVGYYIQQLSTGVGVSHLHQSTTYSSPFGFDSMEPMTKIAYKYPYLILDIMGIFPTLMCIVHYIPLLSVFSIHLFDEQQIISSCMKEFGYTYIYIYIYKSWSVFPYTTRLIST